MFAWRNCKASLLEGTVEKMNVAQIGYIIERHEYLRWIVAVTSFSFEVMKKQSPVEIRGTFWSWWNSWRNLTPQTTLCPASQNEMIECCASFWLYSWRAEKITNVTANEAGDGHVEEHFIELSNITSFNAYSAITESIEHAWMISS